MTGSSLNFRQLYEEHFPFVWRTLRRLGVREADIQDATQEVFLVVYRKLDEFEGRAKLTTWLFRIAFRIAKDRQKRAYRKREVFDEESVQERVDPTDDASRCLERQEEQALFESALARMDLDQRAVFTLFELEGLTGDEIALVLQIPLGTVYSRLRLGREAFRKEVVRHQQGFVPVALVPMARGV
jgi:RNA polymerase sigma-70 factor, ECF subfamily